MDRVLAIQPLEPGFESLLHLIFFFYLSNSTMKKAQINFIIT